MEYAYNYVIGHMNKKEVNNQLILILLTLVLIETFLIQEPTTVVLVEVNHSNISPISSIIFIQALLLTVSNLTLIVKPRTSVTKFENSLKGSSTIQSNSLPTIRISFSIEPRLITFQPGSRFIPTDHIIDNTQLWMTAKTAAVSFEPAFYIAHKDNDEVWPLLWRSWTEDASSKFGNGTHLVYTTETEQVLPLERMVQCHRLRWIVRYVSFSQLRRIVQATREDLTDLPILFASLPVLVEGNTAWEKIAFPLEHFCNSVLLPRTLMKNIHTNSLLIAPQFNNFVKDFTFTPSDSAYFLYEFPTPDDNGNKYLETFHNSWKKKWTLLPQLVNLEMAVLLLGEFEMSRKEFMAAAKSYADKIRSRDKFDVSVNLTLRLIAPSCGIDIYCVMHHFMLYFQEETKAVRVATLVCVMPGELQHLVPIGRYFNTLLVNLCSTRDSPLPRPYVLDIQPLMPLFSNEMLLILDRVSPNRSVSLLIDHSACATSVAPHFQRQNIVVATEIYVDGDANAVLQELSLEVKSGSRVFYLRSSTTNAVHVLCTIVQMSSSEIQFLQFLFDPLLHPYSVLRTVLEPIQRKQCDVRRVLQLLNKSLWISLDVVPSLTIDWVDYVDDVWTSYQNNVVQNQGMRPFPFFTTLYDALYLLTEAFHLVQTDFTVSTNSFPLPINSLWNSSHVLEYLCGRGNRHEEDASRLWIHFNSNRHCVRTGTNWKLSVFTTNTTDSYAETSLSRELDSFLFQSERETDFSGDQLHFCLQKLAGWASNEDPSGHLNVTMSFNETALLELSWPLPPAELELPCDWLNWRSPQRCRVIPLTLHALGLAVLVLMSSIMFVLLMHCAWRRHRRKLKFNTSVTPIDVVQELRDSIQDIQLNWRDVRSAPDVPPIGEGLSGTVFRGELRLRECQPASSLWMTVALKEVSRRAVRLSPTDEEVLQQEMDLLREALILRQLNHTNILRLLGVVYNQNQSMSLVLEFAPLGDVKSFLTQQRCKLANLEISMTQLSCKLGELVQDLVRGVCYLHLKGIIHRDLACRNCLLFPGERLKIGDFGLARLLQAEHKNYYRVISKVMLPLRWMSPESMVHSHFSSASDVWSVGVVAVEMMTLGETPYAGCPDYEVQDLVGHGKITPLSWVLDFIKTSSLEEVATRIPDTLYHWLQGCFVYSPQGRISLTQHSLQQDRIEMCVVPLAPDNACEVFNRWYRPTQRVHVDPFLFDNQYNSV